MEMVVPRLLPSPRRLGLAFLALALGAPAGAQRTLFEASGPSSVSWGRHCGVIGDWDGDGFGDVLVTAEYEANGAALEAGSVSVLSGVDGRVLAVFRGTRPGDHFGEAASAAGDVDGDGFADLCVGAPEDDVPGIGTDAGSAVVLSGRDGRVLLTILGSRGREFLGTACAPAGDLNGDGHDDVLISAPSAVTPTGLFAGSVAVYSGADGQVLVRAWGNRSFHRLGTSVSTAGDADGDGVLDFVAVQYDRVRLFSGRDGHQLQVRSYPNQGGSLVVSGGIDADADGFADYLIGTHMTDTFRGRAEVISGKDGSVLHTVLGQNPYEMLGFSVAAAGDLDGDGHGDFAVGIPRLAGPAGSASGGVRAYSGRTGLPIGTVPGTAASLQMGGWIDAGRDIDGDGVPDVVASSLSGRLQALTFVPRGLAPYGRGTPGCAGPLTLLANGVPTLGNAAFALHLAHAGADVTSLLIGDTPDVAGTMRHYALFHLAPGTILLRTTLPRPDAHGTLVVPMPVPNDPSLLGAPLYLQGVSFFPPGTCARRIATTPGLGLTFQ